MALRREDIETGLNLKVVEPEEPGELGVIVPFRREAPVEDESLSELFPLLTSAVDEAVIITRAARLRERILAIHRDSVIRIPGTNLTVPAYPRLRGITDENGMSVNRRLRP